MRWLCLVLLFLSCGSEKVNPLPKEEGVIVRFKAGDLPNIFDVPWPSDIYKKDGRILENIPGFSAFIQSNEAYVAHELARMDGFSRVGVASFIIDDTTAPANEDGSVAQAEIDPASLPARETDCVSDGSSVFLVDMDAMAR